MFQWASEQGLTWDQVTALLNSLNPILAEKAKITAVGSYYTVWYLKIV
jgi:hypothetical protein